MITPKEAEELSREEIQEVGELEHEIDDSIRRVYVTNKDAPYNVCFDDQLPNRLVAEIIRRYSSHWDISYAPPHKVRDGGRYSGSFMLAEKNQQQGS